jgi:hypothetical protein
VILIAGFSFGILGMIIAVPLFTILKSKGRIFSTTRSFKCLLNIWILDKSILKPGIQQFYNSKQLGVDITKLALKNPFLK